MKRIHTLEIEEQTKDGKQVTLEVDYDSDFAVYEIRAWSEYFQDFVPIKHFHLQKYEKSALDTIDHAIRSHYEEMMDQTRKDRELAVYLGK